MNITAYDIASRFLGLSEVAGTSSNPAVLAMLRLDAGSAIADDATPWCSAFVNYVCWLLRLPRSKSLAARSWLEVGAAVDLDDARVGWDVVILSRGDGTQPGPEVTDAPGHVGLFSGRDGAWIMLLGGNQGDKVSVARFDPARVLGVRRLRQED